MKKLYYGGYGKYNYYTVADTEEEALQNLRTNYGLAAMPVTAKEVNNIEGYTIFPISEEELQSIQEPNEVGDKVVSEVKAESGGNAEASTGKGTSKGSKGQNR